MMSPQDVHKALQNGLPKAVIEVEDLTGTQDHYRVVIVCDDFLGKSLLQRHQLVNEILKEPLKGPIHALSIQAHTSQEWQARAASVSSSAKPQGIKF